MRRVILRKEILVIRVRTVRGVNLRRQQTLRSDEKKKKKLHLILFDAFIGNDLVNNDPQ